MGKEGKRRSPGTGDGEAVCEKLVSVAGPYNIIYADPPWKYTSKSVPPNREVVNHYSTMPLEEIKSLPVHELADPKNCILFLWATGPCLPEALEVMKAWGFEYKTVGFVWVKLNKGNGKPFMGMGAYTRANCEYVLLGVRGRNLPRLDKGVRQLVFSVREEHSKKPGEVRDRIVELYGDVPRIELFARQRVEGWVCWGDEAPAICD